MKNKINIHLIDLVRAVKFFFKKVLIILLNLDFIVWLKLLFLWREIKKNSINILTHISDKIYKYNGYCQNVDKKSDTRLLNGKQEISPFVFSVRRKVIWIWNMRISK